MAPAHPLPNDARAGAAGEAAVAVPPSAPEWFGTLVERLPGLRHTFLGRLVPPRESSPRQSAVLVLFSAGEGDGPDVLLTQRSAGLRSHAGQVAFPGGRLDPEDAGLGACALREGREETGLDPAGVAVAGYGPQLWVPVSNYAVTPVVAWWEDPSPVGPIDRREVVRVVRVPLVELVDPVNRFMVMHPSGNAGPGFEVRGLFVWGFTAAVLTGMLALAGWERGWDTGRTVPLPAQPTPEQVAAEQAVPDPDAGLGDDDIEGRGLTRG